jgi:lycopene cyclase domain-containing protein
VSYAGLALIFLAAAATVCVTVARAARLPGRWWAATALAALVLVALTAVFDSLMIAADLFRYDGSALTGVRVLRVPVEDFAWPLVAVLLLPALWELLGLLRSRTQGTSGDAGDAGDAGSRREH